MTTLFHEFGHGLHHMLTQVDDLGVSGISGVEWDAVELPSQFMENFCWEWDVLQAPDGARRDAASRCRARCSTRCSPRRTSRAACRRCARSSSRCSTCTCTAEPGQRGDACRQLADEVRDEIAVLPPPPFNRFLNYVRAHLRRRLRGRLLQLQVGRGAVGRRLSAFEEAASEAAACSTSRPAGATARTCSSRAAAARAMESFKAFRGREPRIDALLRHQGLTPLTRRRSPG